MLTHGHRMVPKAIYLLFGTVTSIARLLAPRDGLLAAAPLVLRFARTAAAKRVDVQLGGAKLSNRLVVCRRFELGANGHRCRKSVCRPKIIGSPGRIIRATRSPLRGRPTGDHRRFAALSNRLVVCRRFELGANGHRCRKPVCRPKNYWLPGTDSNRRPTD